MKKRADPIPGVVVARLSPQCLVSSAAAVVQAPPLAGVLGSNNTLNGS